MRKFLFPVLLASVLFGCGSKSSRVENETQKPKEKNIAAFINGFVSEHPNMLNNEVTKADASEQLGSSFSALAISDSLRCISDLPSTFVDIAAYKGDSLFVVKFYYPDVNNVSLSSDFHFAYRVLSILKREAVVNLVEGSYYYLSGCFAGYLDSSLFLNYLLSAGDPSLSVYDICNNGRKDFPSVSSVSGSPYLDFGTIFITDLKICPVNEN